MARRSGQNQGATLREIRSAAFRLFGQHGFDGVSVLAVANSVGITKAALYWHYDGKQALYLDCYAELQSIFTERLFSGLQAGGDSRQQLLEFFIGIARLLEDERIRAGVAGYWMQPGSTELPEARLARAQLEEHCSSQLAALMQRAVDAEVLTTPLEVDEMATTMMSFVEALVLPFRSHTVAEIRRQVGIMAYTFLLAYENGSALAEQALAFARGETAPI